MEYRVLGKSGLRVSRLGLGGIPIQKSNEDGAKRLIGALMREGVLKMTVASQNGRDRYFMYI